MWFDGPIENAVAKAKSEKELLVIFVCGDDENSRSVLAYWNDDSVKKLVTENSCVALKLTEGSEPAKMFAQIYPVVSIPICFFITPEGGVPMEVVANFENLESFKERVSKVIETFRESAKPVNVAESHSSPTLPERASSLPIEEKETPSSPPASKSEDQPTSNSNDLHERVQKAQTLVKQRKEEKSFEEKENARLAELKRRQEGQEFQKAQERIKEVEAMRNAQDQKKAKQEDKEYLKKLREQIAADRAEKASKFTATQSEGNQQHETKAKRVEMEEKQRQEEEEQRKRFSLLQFRLPDGSSLRHQFDGTALFREAREWFSRESNYPESSFLLVQMYPRREFSPEDGTRSLVELGLTPSAVLMVLPNAGVSSQGPVQGSQSSIGWLLSTIFYTVTAPVRFVYSLLYGFLFGTGASARPVTGGQSNNRNSPSARDQQRSGTSGAGASNSGGNNAGGSNVVRFRNKEDSKKDDDNATWNGNSTQQL